MFVWLDSYIVALQHVHVTQTCVRLQLYGEKLQFVKQVGYRQPNLRFNTSDIDTIQTS